MLIIKNVSIFDGNSIIPDKTVLIQKKQIFDIISNTKTLSQTIHNKQVIDGKGNLLIPGFIDLQINGGGGELFNHNPSVASLKKIFAAHLKYGTTNFFPTLISDSFATLNRGLHAVESGIKKATSGILGMHFEGPFLNVEKKGIHPESHIQTYSKEILDLMLNSSLSKVLVTLAPEIVLKSDMQKLYKKNIFVFAGHTNATGREMQQAFKNGVCGLTHLFNASSQMTARNIGAVGATLLDQNSFNTVIADSIHVSNDMLRLAFKLKEAKNFALISDAMQSVGTRKKTFSLFKEKIFLKDSSLQNKNGTLAGAHLTMLWAFQNIMKKKLMTLSDAIGMTSTNQAKYLGLKNKGAVLPGFDANLLLLDQSNLKLLNVIFLGKLM